MMFFSGRVFGQDKFWLGWRAMKQIQLNLCIATRESLSFTFKFMHLADAFIPLSFLCGVSKFVKLLNKRNIAI